MNIKTASTIATISLWWHLFVIIMCYALVYSSLGNDTIKTDVPAWDGLSYNDPQRNIKIFSYVFSIYLGVEMSEIRPRNGFAYIVRNIILFGRMLFVLNVAKNIFVMMAEHIQTNSPVDVEELLNRFLSSHINKLRSPIRPFISSKIPHIAPPHASAVARG